MTISALRYLCVAALLPIAASRVAPAGDARDSAASDIDFNGSLRAERRTIPPDVRFATLGAGRPSVAITARGGLRIGVAGTGPEAGVSARIDISPVDGSPTLAIAATEQLPTKVHQFVGSDPSKWRRNIPTAARVRVPQLYDGIDLKYYGTERDIEYDFIVAPGADPGVIGLRVAGADVRRDESGGLILTTPAGDVHQRRPIAYQDVGAGRQDVPVEYRVSDSVVTFDIGAYDRTRPLVIDPILVVSTFRGDANDDSGRAVTFGTDGLFVAGTVDRGPDGLVSELHNVFVAKYSLDGRTLLFITYYGGTQRTNGEGDPLSIRPELLSMHRASSMSRAPRRQQTSLLSAPLSRQREQVASSFGYLRTDHRFSCPPISGRRWVGIWSRTWCWAPISISSELRPIPTRSQSRFRRARGQAGSCVLRAKARLSRLVGSLANQLR